MRIAELKNHLDSATEIRFRLPDRTYLPPHFHVTEVGLVTKHFIDCGGVERNERVANFQLWEAGDYEHRLAPQKFLHIIGLSGKVLGDTDLEIEVEYQQGTIGKFGLDYDDGDFVLVEKRTACLAQDACGVPAKPKKQLGTLGAVPSPSCTPGSGCC